jgi:hypothetical protein
MSKCNTISATGKTVDGKDVMKGVYEFHDTHGMPLPFLLSVLKENNAIPDWIDVYQRATQNGMKHERILSKLKDPIEDSYGVSFAEHVLNKLDEKFKESDG